MNLDFNAVDTVEGNPKERKKYIKTLKKIVKEGQKRANKLLKREKRDMTIGFLVFFFVFIVLFFILWNIFWRIPIISPWKISLVDENVPKNSMAFNLSALFFSHLFLGFNNFRGYYWPSISEWLQGSQTYFQFMFVNISSLLISLIASFFVSKDASTGKVIEEHLSGRRLYERIEDAITATKEEIAVHGKGINIHPLVPISRDRETRHFFVLGAIGAGKTQVLRNILNSVIIRLRKGPEDRLIIYDNKSDVTEGVPVDDDEMILLAPWDKRTWAWDVAKDVLNDADAAEVASRLIPDSDDPFWANAARQVLISIFAKLQREKGTNWSWVDVNKGIGDDVAMVKAITAYNPTLAAPFKDPTSKAAQNIVVTLATFASTIRYLTQAWDNIDPVTNKEYEPGRVIQKLSLREWALSPEVERRVIVLQGNKRYSVLEKSYVQAIISALGGIMNSPEMTDSKSRRIWMFLDEFPQLGKLDNFAQYLEVGRSKGMCVLIGLQDLAQLREIYGKETADVWASICGTYLVCKSQGVETIDWLIKFFGRKIVKTWSNSVSKQGNSKSEQEKEREIVTAQDILGLKAEKLGIRALLSLNDESGVYRLVWPYVTFKKRRPSQVPAAWTTVMMEQNIETTKNNLTKALSELFAKGFEKNINKNKDILSEEEDEENNDEDNEEYNYIYDMNNRLGSREEDDEEENEDDSDENFFSLNEEPISLTKNTLPQSKNRAKIFENSFNDFIPKNKVPENELNIEDIEKIEKEKNKTILNDNVQSKRQTGLSGLDNIVNSGKSLFNIKDEHEDEIDNDPATEKKSNSSGRSLLEIEKTTRQRNRTPKTAKNKVKKEDNIKTEDSVNTGNIDNNQKAKRSPRTKKQKSTTESIE